MVGSISILPAHLAPACPRVLRLSHRWCMLQFDDTPTTPTDNSPDDDRIEIAQEADEIMGNDSSD